MPDYTIPIVDFSLIVTNYVLQNRKEINYSISTTSIYLALAMIQAGAKGKSRSELAKLLGVDFSSLLSSNSDDNQLFVSMKQIYEELNLCGDLATNIFTAVRLRNDYIQLLGTMLHVNGEVISFQPPSAAVKIINHWVAEHTHDRIVELLKESNITPGSLMVLVNTIYFQGVWKESFSEKLTKDAEFKLESGKTITVPFMIRKLRANIYDDKEKRFKALIMDFKSKNYGGVILLPKEGTTLKKLISSLETSDIKNLVGKSRIRDSVIQIPKFKIDRKTKVKKILKALGVNAIFDKNKSDLSNMSDVPLWVDDIIHRSTVKINEKGATAADFTTMDIPDISPSSLKLFVANRPFIFIVLDQGIGLPLFINAIYDPSKS